MRIAKENNSNAMKQASVFVLDNDQERIDLFKKAYGSQNIVVASNVKNSLNLLRSRKFAKVFLDRDLSSTIENGEDVAWQMKQEKLCQETPVVIHSENTRGQRVMAKYLGSYHNDVTIIPFRQLKKQLDIPGGIKLAQDILNQSEETESNNEPRHWALRVTFDDGDVMPVEINGTLQEVKDYYLNNEFVLSDETTMHKPINVEVLENMGPATYYKEDTLNKKTMASRIPDMKCPNCGAIGEQNSECKFCHKHIPGRAKSSAQESWDQQQESKFEPSWEKRLKLNEKLNKDYRENKTAQIVNQDIDDDGYEYTTIHLEQLHQIAEKYAIALDVNDVRSKKDPITNELQSIELSFESYEFDGEANSNGLSMFENEINNIPGVSLATVQPNDYRIDIYLNENVEID